MQLTTAMLADDAVVADGKLYVFGGGWDSVQAEVPVTLARIALALVLRVEYTEALTDLPISIELVDEDDRPTGTRIGGVLNTGHAPRTRAGTPSFIPQAIQFENLKFDALGGYRFRVTSGDQELASIPFRIIGAPVV